MDIMQMRRGMGASGSPLPYDAEIEYLESDGNQYIDTGILFTDDLDFFITYSRSDATTAGALFGYRSTASATANGDMRFCFAYTDGRFAIRYGGTPLNGTLAIARDEIVLAQKAGNDVRVFAPNVGDQLIINTINVYQPYNPKSIYLFWANTEGFYSADIAKFVGKVYTFKLTSNSVVLDFIPVRVGQVGYMYDKVSGQLFGNIGTGAFILGPDK